MRDEDEWTDDEVDYQNYRSSTGSDSVNRFPRSPSPSSSPSTSPKPYRGRLQEHFSWAVSPNTIDRALRSTQPSRLRHQASSESAAPSTRGRLASDPAPAEVSTIAFHFSIGEDDDSDEEENPFEPQSQAQSTSTRTRSGRPSPLAPLSVQTRRLAPSSTNSSPLLALLSLPLPSYAPLTPPGHQLQESGPNSPSLALSNAEEEQSNHECGTSEHSASSPVFIRDQPLSATLRRLGARRKSQKLEQPVEEEAGEEDCIFASEQRRAFSSGRFDPRPAGFGGGPVPQSRSGVVSTAPRGVPLATVQKDDVPEKLAEMLVNGRGRSESSATAVPSLNWYAPSSSLLDAKQQEVGQDPRGRSVSGTDDSRADSRNLLRPPRDTSRWTRLADGWGGLLPPRDWFSSRTLGPLRSPSVPVPSADTQATSKERSGDVGESDDIASDGRGHPAAKHTKKHKSLLLTKLRRIAEDAPPLPKERPAPSRKKTTSDSTSNGNGNTTSDWEDVWVPEAEGGPTHQLVQHLMQPLVHPEIPTEGSTDSRAQRRVRFASFLPTLKQATRMPLYPPLAERDRSYAQSEEEHEEEQEERKEEDYRKWDEDQREYLPRYGAAAALRQEKQSRKKPATTHKTLRPFSLNKSKPGSTDTRDKDIELGVYPFASSSCASSQRYPRKNGPYTRSTHLLRRRIMGVLLPAGASRPLLLSLLLFLLLLAGTTIGLSLGLIASKKSLRTARTALSPLEGQISTLQSQAEALNEQITSLNAQVATLNSEEDDLKTQLASAKAEEAKSEEALKTLAAKVSSALDAASLSSTSTSGSGSGSATTASPTSATTASTGNATTSATNATTASATMTASAR
ncbi:hypothetical protein BCV69DRAFT_283051 [Microstroma glucosiphilum]|uniref:Uncharacterized protein n=1 Tax=Pseudomicrostroma glucosiphilum TaxID=1684307 RepID=A0A316U7M5_9BASI|nr:hypothetical protein BCV69DRAFT_283051 [Pseudomicrostroma glucosiphilum]PWN20838.1 hypothetical protein BCV69DRAFT_283051 [Pseudomicrostroma glucosiphilum]